MQKQNKKENRDLIFFNIGFESGYNPKLITKKTFDYIQKEYLSKIVEYYHHKILYEVGIVYGIVDEALKKSLKRKSSCVEVSEEPLKTKGWIEK